MTGTQPGYIISVFQLAGMCTGSFDYKEVAARLQTQLRDLGLELTAWEPVSQSGCFAVLVWAEARAGGRVDLLEARRQLTGQLAPQQLQVRIQREDVFLAMHRL
jgi:predicted amino acid-binding ACT domain protein